LGTGKGAIRKVTPGGIISTVAGDGTQGFSGDGGLATSARFGLPWGVAVDGSGNLFISDIGAQRVRKVTPDGIIRTLAGNGTQGYSGDNGPSTGALLHDPMGIATDSAGNLYLADFTNSVIRKVTTAGIISTVAGNGSFGYSGDGGPATKAQISSPTGIAVDAAGNLYLLDSNNMVLRQVTPMGTIFTVAGNGTAGYSGDGLPAVDAQFNNPTGVAADKSGNLYLADTGNNVIRKLGQGGQPVTDAPAFGLFSGSFTGPQTVTITDSTAGATIYYTTDGTPPTTLSAVYSAPLTIAATQTVQAIAVAAGFAPSPVATASYTINAPAAQSIQNFTTFGVLTYGQGPIQLQATSSSGLPVSFNVSGPATVSGSLLTITGVGHIEVTAYQLGNGDYAPAQSVIHGLTVNSAPLTVTANDKTTAYGQSIPVLDYTVTGFVNGENARLLQGAAATTTTAGTSPAGGTYPITVSAGSLSASNYRLVFVSGTLTVTGGAAQIIQNFTSFGALTYGHAPVHLQATSSSGLPVSFNVSGPATVSDSLLTITGVGHIEVTAYQLGNGDYAPAQSLIHGLNVTPAPLTVTANDKTTAYGQSIPVLDYTVTGFVNGENASLLQGAAVTTTTAGTSPAGGSYPITVSAGSLSASNYRLVFVNGTLTVTGGAAQSIQNFTSFGVLSYGQGPIQLQATSSSGLPVSYNVSGPATLSGTLLTITGVGHVEVTAYQLGNGDYAPAPSVIHGFTVGRAPLKVTANNASRVVGAANPVFTPSYSGFVNGETAALLSGAPDLSSAATAASPAGFYPITVTQGTLSAANYSIMPVNGVLSVVVPPTALLNTTSTLSRVSGGYQADVTITNTGTGTAFNVQLTSAALGWRAECRCLWISERLPRAVELRR
jgi:hypothetical protein